MKKKSEQNLFLFAQVIVPELYNDQTLEKQFMKNILAIVDGLESDSSSKIKLLTNVVAKLSFAYNLQPFQKLDYNTREKYVQKLFNFPIGQVVAGLTGLRSIVFIAYYGIEDIWKTIDYQGPIVTKDKP